MEELCKTVGEIKDIVIKANWAGNKSAEVLFARRSDAISCVSKFNGIIIYESKGNHSDSLTAAFIDRTNFGWNSYGG